MSISGISSLGIGAYQNTQSQSGQNQNTSSTSFSQMLNQIGGHHHHHHVSSSDSSSQSSDPLAALLGTSSDSDDSSGSTVSSSADPLGNINTLLSQVQAGLTGNITSTNGNTQPAINILA